MEKVIHTVLHAGLEKPVKILHVTDVHLVETNDRDTEEHKALETRRRGTFRAEGNFPPYTQNEYFEEAVRMAEELGAVLMVTGDVMDIQTQGNIAEFHRIIDGHDAMFTPGGHEHQRICRRTMEEPDGYWIGSRQKLKEAFPEFDMDFSSRVVNGLNIIAADNSLDYFNAETVRRFKAELEKGLPIVIFFHDPIWDRMLNVTEPTHPNVQLTPEDYATSHEMIDLINNHPLIVASIAGHGHVEAEKVVGKNRAFMTPGLYRGACRLIEIV